MRASSSAPMRATTSARSATSATSSRSCGCVSSTRRRPPRQARQTRDELRRRGNEPFAELYLVEAVALYEMGEEMDAVARAERAIALAARPGEPVATRAWFLKGRIAADHADAAGIRAALAALGPLAEP